MELPRCTQETACDTGLAFPAHARKNCRPVKNGSKFGLVMIHAGKIAGKLLAVITDSVTEVAVNWSDLSHTIIIRESFPISCTSLCTQYDIKVITRALGPSRSHNHCHTDDTDTAGTIYREWRLQCEPGVSRIRRSLQWQLHDVYISDAYLAGAN